MNGEREGRTIPEFTTDETNARELIPALWGGLILLAPRLNEGRHREASRWCELGAVSGSPHNGRSVSLGRVGYSPELLTGSRTRRGASMPAWTARLQQSQASDAPLPHFFQADTR